MKTIAMTGIPTFGNNYVTKYIHSLTNPIILLIFDYNRYIQTKFNFFIMTICYPDTMTVKRDIQRRIEGYVNQYCRTLEENFKQYSINSYKRNLTDYKLDYKSYYQEQLEKIENGTANLYKFDYTVGKKYIKVFFLQYEESNDYYGRKAGYRAGSVTAFIDRNTGEVYKPASWKAPAKHVRFDLRIIKEREFLLNPANCDWAGGHLYMR